MNAYQGAQFFDDPTERPQSIVLDEDEDEDEAGIAVDGGLYFIEELRGKAPAENEWNPSLRERAGRSFPRGSVVVEPSQGSRTVFSEVRVETNGNNDREGALCNGKRPTTSFSNSESGPTNQAVPAPPQNQTTISKTEGFLKNNVPLGISFIIVIPTVVGVAVGFGTKGLVSGTAAGGSSLVIFTAIFAYLHMMRRKKNRSEAREERRQREGQNYGP